MPLSKFGFVGAIEDLIAKTPSNEIPLDLAALALVIPITGSCDIGWSLRELDSLAEEALALAGEHASNETKLEALRVTLFDKHHFRGNAEDYYNPDNCFLNRVLESRKGMPITLSLIMIEVGRRLGLPMVGIGLPCHFVAAYLSNEGVRYFDPFQGGIERTREECRDLVSSISGGSIEADDSHFAPVSTPHYLARMLCNLRSIYRQRGEYANLAKVLRQMLLLKPNNPPLHLELAAVLAEVGSPLEALHHLSLHAKLIKDPSERGPITVIEREIRKRLAFLN